MSNENAERLASALSGLGYAEPVEWGEDEFGSVNVMCRIKSQSLGKWAQLVKNILVRSAALRAEGNEAAWASHICRLYLLKNGELVYGWLVNISSPFMADSLSELIPVIKGQSSQEKKAPKPVITTKPALKVVPKKKNVVRAVPDADARGNPIVPPSHRVTVVPMAGLDPELDRNAPSDMTEGKGAHGMFKSSKWGDSFKPPRTR